ncbi:MAG: sugar diacid recognition domain-containing protein [bacterium]|nr:sugar diacid recognition domain-containing protein [bacterium]
MTTRISRKVAQQIVNTVKDVCGYDINYIDEYGTIFASTNEERVGQYHEIGRQVAASNETIEVAEDNSFLGTKRGVNIPIYHNGVFIAVIGISGEPEAVRQFAYLAVRITMLLIREQEIESFHRTKREKMKYVMDSLLYGQKVNHEYLSLCLEEMNLNMEEKMRVLYIQINTRYNLMNLSLIEQRLMQLFDSIGCSFYSYHYPSEYIAIISEKCMKEERQQIEAFAEEYNKLLTIALGARQSVYQIKKSYETAKIASSSLQDGKASFASFDDLDLGMIYGSMQPEIRDKYKAKTMSALTKEDKEVLQVYYEEEMSLTATCKRLFLHKNTLQYKLDRIARETGYNPRKFKDAVVLYLALNM